MSQELGVKKPRIEDEALSSLQHAGEDMLTMLFERTAKVHNHVNPKRATTMLCDFTLAVALS